MWYFFYSVVIITIASLIFGLLRYERSKYYKQERLSNRTAQLKQKYTLDSEKQSIADSFINYCKEEYDKRRDEK